MVKNLLCFALMVIIFAGCTSQDKPAVSKAQYSKDYPEKGQKLLRHVVLLKFKQGTKPERIKEVEMGFAALPAKIDSIKGFEWGTNVSKELTDGFTHCFVVTFADDAGLQAYLYNPDLVAFRKTLRGTLEKAIAADYWTISEQGRQLTE